MPLGKTPILQQDTMAESDTSKYILFNDALVKLEDAQNRAVAVDLASADVTLTESELLRYGVFKAQGHTVARELTIPATVGSGDSLATTNRVFVVRNEGTGSLQVQHLDTDDFVTLLAGQSAILHADGTDIYALGAGADAVLIPVQEEGTEVLPALAGLNFVGDLITVTDGGASVATITVADPDFLDLGDTPADYATHAGKAIVVNGTEDGVEFATISGGSATFVSLTDTPANFTGQGGKVLAVNIAEDAVEFVDAAAGGAVAFTGLTDTPAAYTGEAGRFLKVNVGETGLEFTDEPAGGGGAVSIEDDGTEIVATASTLNFTGAGVDVTDAGSGEATINISGGGGTAGSVAFTSQPHRYWRLASLRNGSSLSPSAAEIEFRAVVGGSRLTGTATASTDFSASFDAPKAQDDNGATLWSSSSFDGGLGWYQLDLGASTYSQLAELVITARNDSDSDQTPTDFLVQGSDDAEAWITYGHVDDNAGDYTAAETRNYDLAAVTTLAVFASDAVLGGWTDLTVVNGDFETGDLTGWTTNTGAPTVSGFGSGQAIAEDGSFRVSGGTSSFASITQNIDVSGEDDAVLFQVSGTLFKDFADDDVSTFVAELRDASDNVLRRQSLSTPIDAVARIGTSFILPAHVDQDYISLYVSFDRNTGTNNNCGFDNAELSKFTVPPTKLSQAEFTADYDLTSSQFGGNFIAKVDSATPVVATVTAGLTGTEPTTLIRMGAGSVTIAAGAGVTINSADGALALRAQYSSGSLIPVATDEYILIGDLA